ncbi:hypothetical protein C2G38_2207097 [Gigaspora rosea]|uniref:Uncharacterized protein n=1 Tax=Gigaspora rosea TaxID=44941 RepID=A0A397ULQ1_9GLOM|nr:hypothetical protein C2G38_2207097 [Gigaspora rosea]
MSTSILKTHYWRGANILTPKQIEEIRHLKNKVPAYMIVKEKAQSISLENDSEVHAKPPCKAPERSTSKKLSEIMGVPLGPSSAEMNVQEKQKKKKKLLKSGSIRNSDLPEILAVGPCQNSLLDVSHDLIASIKKDHIESKESMRESEKLFALNSPFQYIQ